MRRLLESLGLSVLDVQGDRDFEPESLVQRARALGRVPGSASVAGAGAATLVNVTGWYDAAIHVFAPRSGL